MRLYEFANAEEQLGLWKLVSDSVWSAIQTQVEQDRRSKAARVKLKKGRKVVSSTSPLPYVPPPPLQSVHPNHPKFAARDSLAKQNPNPQVVYAQGADAASKVHNSNVVQSVPQPQGVNGEHEQGLSISKPVTVGKSPTQTRLPTLKSSKMRI